MNCPLCKADSNVIDSRPTDDPTAWRRRRACLGCGYRWSTIEMPLDQARAARRIVKALKDLVRSEAEA